VKYFGPDYKPEPYIVDEYKRARGHKYYMTARLICVNDIYSFDPNAKVNLDDFVDIIGRNSKQPKEGLGFDHTPSSHMWRKLMWPRQVLESRASVGRAKSPAVRSTQAKRHTRTG